jgi:AraC-like DNA-binding protein
MKMSNSICQQAYQIYKFADNSKKNGCKIYHLEDDYGSGEMRCYDVASGIQISYNNLNMDSCFQYIAPAKEFLQIDHCLEGCYEFELENGTVSFLGEGDLCVSNLGKRVFTGSRLPLKKYRGLTVLLEIETAQKILYKDFPQANINLTQIRDKLCINGQSLLIKSRHEIDHIFSELYHVDERIQMPYFWIKVIELLLFLSLLDESHMQRPLTFSEEVSSGTQEVYKYIIENPFAKTTIAELAVMFRVSESSMKRCFKSLSGKSIGTFMKTKRMEAAAELLVEESKLSIGEVAEAAGYENQSKFSAAFKSVYGVTPFAYRCKTR